MLQPDVALVGGITGLRRVGQMAEDHNLVFTPHTWTNGMGVMANAQLSPAWRTHLSSNSRTIRPNGGSTGATTCSPFRWTSTRTGISFCRTDPAWDMSSPRTC